MISVNKGFWLYSFWYLLNQVIYSKDSFQKDFFTETSCLSGCQVQNDHST